MAFRITKQIRTAGSRSHEIFTLADSADGASAEVWPSLGGNCLRWSVAGPGGPMQLLYAAPDWEQNPIPTRSGIPVLFPFPNRIREGRFRWNGKSYQLPINCPHGRHAIHGFACRNSWRVTQESSSADSALICLEFDPQIDAPSVFEYWPGSYRLSLTITLHTSSLTLDAKVENTGEDRLPWGLGYHPYFALLPETEVQLDASQLWELDQYLPTGRLLKVEGELDLRSFKPVQDRTLDHVYRCTPRSAFGGFAALRHGRLGELRLSASPSFSESVVFVPPHRKAICIEPYTCVTNAVNMPDVEGGLQILPAGQHAETRFEMHYER